MPIRRSASSRVSGSSGFDAVHDRARIAVVVVDASSAGSGLDPFIASSLPLTFAVAPGDDDAHSICEAVASAGKIAVVDAAHASARQVSDFLHTGATGIIGSLDEVRSASLMHGLDRKAFVLDSALAEDDDLAKIARARGHKVFTRDVIADARDDAPYVDFMFRDALAIAERTGSAIVAVHARTMTYDALTHFADRALRDGADIVPLTDLSD